MSFENLPEHLGVQHIAIEVENLPRALEFYTKILKFDPYHVKDQDWAMVSKGPTSLSLVPTKKDTKQVPVDGAFHPPHTGITVKKPEDVDAYFNYFKELKVNVTNPPQTHRDKSRGFYFYDTEGNLLELIYIPTHPQ